MALHGSRPAARAPVWRRWAPLSGAGLAAVVVAVDLVVGSCTQDGCEPVHTLTLALILLVAAPTLLVLAALGRALTLRDVDGWRRAAVVAARVTSWLIAAFVLALAVAVVLVP